MTEQKGVILLRRLYLRRRLHRILVGATFAEDWQSEITAALQDLIDRAFAEGIAVGEARRRRGVGNA